MKKRLTCLFLCLVMMLSVLLVGCAEETDEDVQDKIEEMAAKNTVSLRMWIVSEDTVSDTVAAAVTKELSALTEAKYKARLDIKFVTRDKYYESLNSTLSAYIQSGKDKVVVDPNTDTTDDTVVGEDGLLKDRYPELDKNQVDIIYIGDVAGKSGEAFFNEFVSKGYLAKLDDSINANAKMLREYLSPTLLSAVQKNGVTYAIPNNNVIGEYTYMLMNKELMDVIFSGYVLDGSIDSLYNDHVYGFLDQIMSMTDSSVLPIGASYEECLEYLAHYWSIDSNTYEVKGTDFSVFGTLYEDLSKLSRGSVSLDVESLFANPEFVKSYLKLNSYRFNADGREVFNKNTAGYEKTAIKFHTGDLTELTEVIDVNTKESVFYYDDPEDGTRYYALPVKYPSATSDDIYGNMFGVYSNARDVSRCMDIITYINTNEKARNILQYGVLDEHYSLREREVEDLDKNERSYFAEPKRENGKILYNMDIYSTGNAFLAYMTADMNEKVWERGKEQNRSSLVDPLLGFDLADFAASAAKIGNEIELPSALYEEKLSCDFTYSSGYSKEVLSQNASLKSWIEKCDKAAEKGVFVYKTYSENKSSQKMDAIFYVYNTLGKAAPTVDAKTQAGIPAFEVIATPKKEAVMDGEKQKVDKDGKPVYSEIGMDLSINYGDLSAEGYTLSIIKYTGTSNANYQTKLTAQIGGKAKTVSESAANYIISFDALNTKYYNVNVYGDLFVDHFKSNAYIYNTVDEWITDGGNVQRVLTWKDTSGATKDSYTFLIYFGDVTSATDLDVNVLGGAKTPVLDLSYTAEGFAEDNEGKLKPVAELKEMLVNGKQTGDYKSSSQYILYYVTAEVEKGVTFSVNATHKTVGSTRDGAIGKIEPLAIEQLYAEDPSSKMDVYGELDTELVAYMETLNATLVGVLDACKTYGELEEVVKDFSVLLSVKAAPKLADLQSDAVKALFASDKDLEALHEKVVHITSYKDPSASGSDDAEEGETEEGEDAGDEAEDGESEEGDESTAPSKKLSDIYYYSPFGIYYQWMKAYAYLPK